MSFFSKLSVMYSHSTDSSFLGATVQRKPQKDKTTFFFNIKKYIWLLRNKSKNTKELVPFFSFFNTFYRDTGIFEVQTKTN